MCCAIWYHLYNLKNVKNTHGGVLILVKLQALKLALLHGYFSHFLNCANGTKSCNASQMCDRVWVHLCFTYCKSSNFSTQPLNFQVTPSDDEWKFQSLQVSIISLKNASSFSKGRSSRRRCFVTEGVLRNLTKFTGKHLRQSLFFNEVASLRKLQP